MKRNATSVYEQTHEQLTKEVRFLGLSSTAFAIVCLSVLFVVSIFESAIFMQLSYSLLREGRIYPLFLIKFLQYAFFVSCCWLAIHKHFRMQQAHAELNRRRSSDSK